MLLKYRCKNKACDQLFECNRVGRSYRRICLLCRFKTAERSAARAKARRIAAKASA